MGEKIPSEAVARFRAAWHAADREGRKGNRVRAGLEAARPLLNLEALEIIDKTIMNASVPSQWGAGEVVAMLRGIRESLGTSAPDVCMCSATSEDRGGGYSELMIEPEPDCPEHGEQPDNQRAECEEEATEFYTELAMPVQLCASCDHNARRSGWEPGQ